MNVTSIMIQTSIRKWYLCLSILISVLGCVLFSLLPPYILSQIVDTLTSQSQISFDIISFYFISLLLNNVMLSIRDSLLLIYGQKITHALRTALMQKYSNLDITTITQVAPGSVVSRFMNDVDTVESLFTNGIISLGADAISLISILVIIFHTTKGLFYTLLLILPFLYLFTRHVQKSMLKSEIENRKAVQETNAFIPQVIQNILTIHNLNKQTYFEQKYDASIQKGYLAITKTNFYDALYSPVIQCTNACIIALVLLLSSTNDSNILVFFSMSVGSAVMIIQLVSQIFAPIESIGMEITTIQSALSGVQRINEFLRYKDKNPSKNENISNTNQDIVIDIQNISFAYQEEDILHDYSLTIYKGEHITLLGRTGSGKSTLFKLILGLYEPNEGKVLVFDHEPYHLDSKQKRKIFGYVEQTFHPVLGSIKDQITLYDSSITDEQVIIALKRCHLYETICTFQGGINTSCKEELFSKGQWQLLSIARAIVTNPSILMLDEITASLDAESEKEILETLDSVSKDRTVISISHRKSADIGRSIELK